jgi:hypothetical protein
VEKERLKLWRRQIETVEKGDLNWRRETETVKKAD